MLFGQNCNEIEGIPRNFEDFSNYQVGPITAQSDNWKTWSEEADDANITNDSSFLNIQKTDTSATDVLYLLGQDTVGRYRLSCRLRIRERGYYNVQYTEAGGADPDWAFEVLFSADKGQFRLNGSAVTFNYPLNKWFSLVHIIDLDKDEAELWIEGTLVYRWQYSIGSRKSNKSLGAINLYASDNVNYDIDDICLTEVVSEICTEAYAPVCVGGATYNNACSASFDGYTQMEWVEGECQNNDSCQSSIPLLVSDFCEVAIYDNFSATPDSLFSTFNCGNTSEKNDIWFNTTVPASGNLKIEIKELSNARSTMLMEVYKGNCDSLELVDCYDGEGAAKLRFFNRPFGEELFIRVADAFDEVGQFGICVSTFTPPPNNFCAEASVINAKTTCEIDTFNTLEAGPSPNFRPFRCDFASNEEQDVWFKLVVPPSGNLSIETKQIGNGPEDTVLEVYKGNCENATFLSCDGFSGEGRHGKLTLDNQTPGDTLIIRAMADAVIGGLVGICAVEIPAPINDDCEESTFLTINDTCTVESQLFFGATPSVDLPNFSCVKTNGTIANDLWFRTLAPSSGGHVEISIFAGSGLRSVSMEVYYGNCGALDFVACSSAGKVRMANLVPNQNIYIRVATLVTTSICENQTINQIGEFSICAKSFSPPTNNLCQNSIPLTVSEDCSYEIFDNTNAAISLDIPPISCLTDNGIRYRDLKGSENDVWFNVTVPTGGNLTIETRQVPNGLTNMILEVYRGDCQSLMPIACDQYSGEADHARIELSNQMEGEELFIRVVSGFPKEEGMFGLAVGSKCLTITNGESDEATAINIQDTTCREPNIFRLPNSAGESVWFKTTTPLSGKFNVLVEPVNGGADSVRVEVGFDSCFFVITSFVVIAEGFQNEVIEVPPSVDIGRDLLIKVTNLTDSTNEELYNICLFSEDCTCSEETTILDFSPRARWKQASRDFQLVGDTLEVFRECFNIFEEGFFHPSDVLIGGACATKTSIRYIESSVSHGRDVWKFTWVVLDECGNTVEKDLYVEGEFDCGFITCEEEGFEGIPINLITGDSLVLFAGEGQFYSRNAERICALIIGDDGGRVKRRRRGRTETFICQDFSENCYVIELELRDCDTLVKDLVVAVYDTSAPQFTPPADLTINQTENLDDLAGIVSNVFDNCGVMDTSFTDDLLPPFDFSDGDVVINRTWTVRDSFGNTSEKVQRITLSKTTSTTELLVESPIVNIYPQPASSYLNLNLALSASNTVSIDIYDTFGTKVAEIIKQEALSAGAYTYRWNTQNVPTGIYLVLVKDAASTITKKALIIR
ncbi:MAG: T9SS type A sorting domain-containing protein [Bacteroidota bacterium]